MNRPNPGLGSLLIAVALAVFLGSGRPARGQDDGFDVPDVDPRANADTNTLQARRAMVAFNRGQMNEAQFDMWVFGNARSAVAARARLESSLKVKLAAVEQITRLTPAQKKKAELAARGDLKRFFDDVEDRRNRFKILNKDQDQAKLAEFYQSLQPVQTAFQSGVFGAGSVFAKTLRKTLDAAQFARYDADVRERNLFRYRAKVGLAVATLDRSVGLTHDQRERLTTLILEGTHPPRKSSQLDTQFVLYQLAHLDEAKVRPIFNEAQWNLVKHQLTGAQAYEQMLTRQGMLP
jgi:hypothetical protein